LCIFALAGASCHYEVVSETRSDKLSAARKRQIAKISADLARIEKSFFLTEDPDLDQRYYELKRKRQHLLRSIILELPVQIRRNF